jgi:hypothetical protein
VTKDDLMKVLRGMGDPGPQRQKKKVRSWLHRAFALAVAANNDAALSETWGRFDIKHNPVTETTLSIPNGVDKDALLDDELRTYWHAIEDVPGIVGIALRLHLILGAPRLAQLLRLQRADIRPDLITLWDIKGRSGTRRPHVLPLDAQANAYVAKLCQEGRYAFSIDGGNSHISYFDLREAALDAVGNKIPRFKLKRLRSGIETLLAKLQVSQDVRGRVQSHGLSGVQNRHYNDYDYFPQKAKALRLLTRAIVGTPSRQTSSVPASTGVQRPAAAHGRRLRPRTARRSLRQRQRLAKPQSRTKVVEVAGKAGGTAPRGNGSGGQGA